MLPARSGLLKTIMPPIRTSHHKVDAPTPKKEVEKRKKHTKLREGAPPGVSKIKSALRQTRRLLAKEGLGADVRIEAERKLAALEADLTVAERAKKERTLATRYHKVKFFDRQKLLRKIKQTKKRIEDAEITSKVRKSLKGQLFDLRVDLNYVMNYPKLEKYISLFPPEVRSGEGVPTSVRTGASSSATEEKREKLREWIRGKMRTGEMNGEPETLEHRPSVVKDMLEHWEGSTDKSKRGAGTEPRSQQVDATDDFFEGGDTVTRDLDAGESAHAQPTNLLAKRSPDKVPNRPYQHAKLSGKPPKKSKHKKHREASSSGPIESSFSVDERE
ncbi:hypothetical protein F5148DRAFT_1227635 [Russula earlei]|uniref:Uncharacterized protein n=1 Tax=Russula earlei TaxID=71964 RepID=A0ACC0TZI4_9AGAM|nr:hypothetical protein F5148DRAFT_1227635 [Russula earlei]